MTGSNSSEKHVEDDDAHSAANGGVFGQDPAIASQDVLQALQRLWATNGQSILDKPELRREIQNMPVPCRGGLKRSLWETYLPRPNLVKWVTNFLADREHFPFLELGETVDERDWDDEWGFLSTVFGVSDKEDTGFFLDMIYYINDANPNGLSNERCVKVARLCGAIEMLCMNSKESSSMRDICRAYLAGFNSIPIPEMYGSPAAWVNFENCVWDAPIYMITKSPLTYVYSSILGFNDKDLELLQSFWRSTACVPGTTWQDLVAELSYLRDTDCRDVGHITEIYEYLNAIVTRSSEGQIKQCFNSQALILAPSNGQSTWLTISDCEWLEHAQLSDKFALSTTYPTLKHFFTRLGDVQPSCEIAYKKLLELSSHTQLRVEELKAALWAFNSVLETTSPQNRPDPLPFLNSRLFPVIAGGNKSHIVSASADFAIADRQKLRGLFSGRAVLLAFSVEEVQRLKPLLHWARLQDRYLSSLVRAITFVSGSSAHPISQPHREIKQKSHIITRVARAIGSPRLQEGFENLEVSLSRSQVLEADTISSRQYILQNGQQIVAPITEGELHIDEESGILKIYVPSDKASQNVCFASVLPQRLLSWLMYDPMASSTTLSTNNNALAVIASILDHDVAVGERILELHGID